MIRLKVGAGELLGCGVKPRLTGLEILSVANSEGLSTRLVFPTCRKGDVWHGFAHGFDALFDWRGVISQHVQSGSEGDHFDLNLLADRAVILSRIAHVIEGEIHNGGVIDVDLHSQPMRLRLVGGAVADFGGSPDFGRMEC